MDAQQIERYREKVKDSVVDELVRLYTEAGGDRSRFGEMLRECDRRARIRYVTLFPDDD